jgi:hypothetical protein
MVGKITIGQPAAKLGEERKEETKRRVSLLPNLSILLHFSSSFYFLPCSCGTCSSVVYSCDTIEKEPRMRSVGIHSENKRGISPLYCDLRVIY